jgi:hypothetical protein
MAITKTQNRRGGDAYRNRKEDLERLSVMSLDIKYSSSSNLDVVSSRCRDVRSVGNTGFVNTLSGLDNLIQSRRDLRRWHPSAEDIPSRNGGSIEIPIGVLPLNQHGSLQRKSRKQTYDSQRHQVNSQV